jgi:hypothetical protein
LRASFNRFDLARSNDAAVDDLVFVRRFETTDYPARLDRNRS